MNVLCFNKADKLETLIHAVDASKCVAIGFNGDENADQIRAMFAASGVTSIENLGLVQHGDITIQLGSVSLHLDSDKSGASTDDSLFSNLLDSLCKKYNISNVDIIACNMLSLWTDKLKELEQQVGVNIRASNDATGNLKSGGNWIQESDDVNIAGIYFDKDKLKDYDGLLVNYTGQTLTDHNFSSQDLTDANFTNAILINVNFEGANLTNANFTNADLTGADLTDADLTGVKSGSITYNNTTTLPTQTGKQGISIWKIIGGYIVGPYVDLTGADLSGADLSGVHLQSVNLTNADLTNANLTNAILAYAIFTNVTLVGVKSGSIVGTPLVTLGGTSTLPINYNIISGYIVGPDVDLTNADLSDVILRSVNLTNADLTNANLTGVDLSGANLAGVDLSGVTLTGAITGPIVGIPAQLPTIRYKLDDGYIIVSYVNANLTNTNYTNDIFAGEDLTNADLTNSTLTNVNFQGTTLTGVTWIGVKSSGIVGTPSAGTLGSYKIIKGHIVGPNVDLTNVDLQSATLTGADLSGATLTGVKSGSIVGTPTLSPEYIFYNGYIVGQYVDLTNADLSGANLTGLDLTGATLTGADLTNADLTSANLTGATLTGADLTNADLEEAKFVDANLTGATLTGTILEGTNFLRTNWTGVKSGSIVGTPTLSPEYIFYNGYIVGQYVDLTNADLSGANLTGLDLTGATLTGATLTGVKSGPIVGTPTLSNNYKTTNGYIVGPNVDLTDADLSGAILTDVDLTGATLTGVKSGSIVGTPTLSPEYIFYNGYIVGQYVDLTSADLSGANLTGLDLTGANLTGATLTGENLTGATLTGAKLSSELGGHWLFKHLTEVQRRQIKIGNETKTNVQMMAMDNVYEFVVVGGDGYVQETSFSVEDSNGTVLIDASGVGAGVTGNASYSASATLQPGDYTLILKDNGGGAGDGWTVSGNSSKLTVDINLDGIIQSSETFDDVWSGGQITYPFTISLNLVDADLTDADLSGANLQNVNLTGALLTGANLTNALLINANFTNINLTDVNFTNATMISPIFTGATTTGIIWTNADLIKSNFTSVNLTNANFTNAKMISPIFTDATTTGITWTNVNMVNYTGLSV